MANNEILTNKYLSDLGVTDKTLNSLQKMN